MPLQPIPIPSLPLSLVSEVEETPEVKAAGHPNCSSTEQPKTRVAESPTFTHRSLSPAGPVPNATPTSL